MRERITPGATCCWPALTISHSISRLGALTILRWIKMVY
jgi:hypothetical protein